MATISKPALIQAEVDAYITRASSDAAKKAALISELRTIGLSAFAQKYFTVDGNQEKFLLLAQRIQMDGTFAAMLADVVERGGTVIIPAVATGFQLGSVDVDVKHEKGILSIIFSC